ncbi:hypothetical protein OIU77_007679 [Salix suchowensis]|uniref:Uncharacterized protein n=1 Tax=Salix suchowensis TaxID=1278906 RepID=A0ABQ9AI68_9ROSI|nr:hypothetical protein OIU77_007679 [Salix suchowensis]
MGSSQSLGSSLSHSQKEKEKIAYMESSLSLGSSGSSLSLGSSQSQSQKEKEKIAYMESSQSLGSSQLQSQKEKEKIAYMADDGAEVEKKNLPGSSKTPKSGGGGIVLAL